jgi:hypothetical protein
MALDFLEGGAMTRNRDTNPPRDIPAKLPMRRFSEGIEAVPSPASAWRIGSFGDGFEHVPAVRARRRQPVAHDTSSRIPPTTLGVEVEAYQALLEGHRAHPEEQQIFDDLLKARAAMERAWLELLAAAPSPEG